MNKQQAIEQINAEIKSLEKAKEIIKQIEEENVVYPERFYPNKRENTYEPYEWKPIIT